MRREPVANERVLWKHLIVEADGPGSLDSAHGRDRDDWLRDKEVQVLLIENYVLGWDPQAILITIILATKCATGNMGDRIHARFF